MKRSFKIIISVVLIIIFILICVTVYLNISAKKENVESSEENISTENVVEDEDVPIDYTRLDDSSVRILDGTIMNEYLLNNFINYVSSDDTSREAKINISVENDDGNKNLTVSFVPNIEGGTYSFSDNGEVREFKASEWSIEKKKEYEVLNAIYFVPSNLNDEQVLICEYGTSAYFSPTFDLTYVRDNSNEINTIISKNFSDTYDYNICTFGGDVTITYKNKKYSFGDALEMGYVTIGDILDQAEIDSNLGKCEVKLYEDGGSTEYVYSNFTILKFNQLEKNYDFYIGMTGSIYDKIENLKNQQKESVNQEEDSTD